MILISKEQFSSLSKLEKRDYVLAWKYKRWRNTSIHTLFPFITRHRLSTTNTDKVQSADIEHKLTVEQVHRLYYSVRQSHDAAALIKHVGISVSMLSELAEMYDTLQLMAKNGITDTQLTLLMSRGANVTPYFLEQAARLSYYQACQFKDHVLNERAVAFPK